MVDAPAPDPLLRVENVSKRFGGVHALKEVSLTLYPGEVLALAGDNGAGKSTLIKIISGVHHADGGSLWYAGKEIKLDNPHQARAHPPGHGQDGEHHGQPAAAGPLLAARPVTAAAALPIRAPPGSG